MQNDVSTPHPKFDRELFHSRHRPMMKVRDALHDRAVHPVNPTPPDKNAPGYALARATAGEKGIDKHGVHGRAEPGRAPASEFPRDLRRLVKRGPPGATALPVH